MLFPWLLLALTATAVFAAMDTKDKPMSRKELTAAVRRLEQLFSSLKPSEVTECPPHWIQFNSSCYGIGGANVTFGAAQAMCSELGGWLVEVDSAEKNNFIENIAHQRKYSRIWLGASDAFSDGNWIWMKSGRLVSEGFTDWLPGQETENWKGNQDCMSLNNKGNYQWYDYECNNVAKFICEVTLAA